MKSFLISVAVFILTALFVLFSAGYIRKTCDSLLQDAEQLQEGSDFSPFFDRWERERIRLRAVVGHLEVDPADQALEEMRSRAAGGDSAGFAAAKAWFLSALKNLRDCETFSFDSVF